MKRAAALFLALVFVCPLTAMDNQPVTLRGVIARNPDGGYLECTVTYDKETGTYSGREYNRGYSKLEWVFQPLKPFDAKQHYRRLLAAQTAAAHEQK